MVLILIVAFILVAFGLIWFLLTHDHGRRLPTGSLWIAFGFGLLSFFIAATIEHFTIPKGVITGEYPLIQSLYIFLGVGFIEEFAKFLPLALFIFKKPYFIEHTDGVIYFAITGLTFGLLENILYTLSYGAKIGLSRLILTPFLHAATTSILGYYLVSYKIDKTKKPQLVLALLVIPILHGLYDFGLGSGVVALAYLSIYITLGFTSAMFIFFERANSSDVRMFNLRDQNTQFFICPFCGASNHIANTSCSTCHKHINIGIPKKA